MSTQLSNQMYNVKSLMKKLNLNNVAAPDFDITGHDEMSNIDYLEYILSEEQRLRLIKRNERRMKQGNVPMKSFITESYSADYPGFQSIMNLEFMNTNGNLVIFGQCRTGKTSLAAELATKIISRDENVFYINICDLLGLLKGVTPFAKNKLDYLTSSRVVIIDEFFYTSISKDELTMLFRFISSINDFLSIIIITNRYFDEWLDIMEDELLVQSLIERLISDGQVFKMLPLNNELVPARKLGPKKRGRPRK